MIFRIVFISIVLFALSTTAFSQIDSLIGQISDSSSEVFAGGISGDGRFVVFESRGNLATENPRNEDGNVEIFLFDYAQRRIFQITDTKEVLFNRSVSSSLFSNIRIAIVNTRPVISNDGRWIAFSSNATTSTPTVPDATNPGSFDGNALVTGTPVPSPSVTPTPNPTATPTPTPAPTATPTPTPFPEPWTRDANLELWLYQIPAYAPVANLSSGDELPVTNLAGGTFTRLTNTDPSQFPRPATTSNGAFVADDNHDASINDDGTVIAFASTRDLVPCVGNKLLTAPPYEDNDEIFTYVRGAASQCGAPNASDPGLRQVTKTLRGPISNPIYNKNPTISGNGRRVVFTSTGDDPIDDPASNTNPNFDTGNNPLSSRNEEIFFTDLTADGRPGPAPASDLRRQITTTTSVAGAPVNILDLGRRMSRDGNYIAFDSYADLPVGTTAQGANKTSFGLYLYNVTANAFTAIGPRSDADTGAIGGDANHYPTFTDTDANGAPATLVLETRLNIKADGTIPTTAADGLNPDELRPTQLYSYPLNVVAPATATFTRLGKFPAGSIFASTQAITSNSIKRFAFNLASTELGSGNFDSNSEVYYFLKPDVITPTGLIRGITFFTGATRQLTTKATPSPTPTPTATPTPTPTPSPSPSVSPTPTPTPVTPDTVFGISPGMLTTLDFGRSRPGITPRTASGSPTRSPGLPFELSGVSITVNGVACLIKSVDTQGVTFVTPRALASAIAGTSYPVVINDNGRVSKGNLTIVPTRPDIFNATMTPAPGGRTKLFNVTNRIFTTEPFAIKTIRRRGDVLTPSVLRIYLTGVANVDSLLVSVRIRDKIMTGIANTNVLVEPGVYTVDFPLDAGLEAAGDQPVVVTITSGGVTFSSRLDDTTSKVSIL